MSVPKLAFFGNEFPSDDVKDVFRRLLRHSRDRRFRLLAAFVDESTAILKEEVAKLPQPLKELVPHFDTVLSLAEHGDFRQGALGAAMESALLTVLEIGLFIGHHEAEGLEMEVTGLAGLSIGLLAAAAVALSGSVGDVVGNGAESVRVSFRLGVYVADMSSKLEAPQPDGTLQSWAYVVTELDEATVREELQRFNADTDSPQLTNALISAADKTSVSVSAPPSRLNAAFQRSHLLRYSKSLPLPVYDGLCHAPHLYAAADIEALFDSTASLLPPDRPVRVKLLSSQSGEPFAATTAHDLFLQIATELTTSTIYLDRLTAGILAHAAAAERCFLASFRTSLVHKAIADALQANCELVRSDMVSWVHTDFGPRRPRSTADAKLAIVGMACRLPGGANDPDLFWELLEQGRDVHTTVPADRFDLKTHYDPDAKVENATQTPYGNFMDKPGFFDAGFFNMSPREAEQTDPMHRLALVTAYEAMEMAGLVPGRTSSSRPQRIATFYGQASDDWRELNASQNISTYAVPRSERAFANKRVNYFFKFSGPSFNIDTACSSGLAAVQAACSALWAGEADTVLAGGLNVITDPDNYAGLCNGHFLSKTGQCKVWDKDADGYCRADGVGSVVIKRLEDAEVDNDNVLAVVLAATTNHSAEAISITHPHAGAQKDNYRHVLQKAGVSPLDISYVELHGTGTQAGDAVESESVADVFAPVAPRRRADQRLHLGAVKSNIGHGEAAAGIASLLKALLVYQKNMIPAHIGIKTEINPTIPTDLERRNVGLTMTNTPWPRQGNKKRLAVVNSFGAHGGNTTLLLEDGPERQIFEGVTVRSMHPVIVSAKSKKSLQSNVENLLYYLDQHSDTSLGDLSYTTCTRRMHHSLRIATAVSSVSGLQKFLRGALTDKTVADARPIPPAAPGVVFTFTGQGAYHLGMGRELFAAFPAFRAEVQQLDRLVQRLGFPSVASVIDGSADDESASPVLTQLSVVALEIALTRFWAVLGVRPSAVIGHSLGEYAALAVAGVLSVADALYLVGRRAQLTEERCTPCSHSMLSVRATEADIARLVHDTPETATSHYEVSCRNTRQDTVIGGARDDIDIIRRVLEAHSYNCVQLDIPFAFHTAQMDDILDALEATAASVPFKAPSIPVLSPLLGAAVFDGKSINAQYLRRAAREPVDFVAAVEAGRGLGMLDEKTLWVDVGPHPICSGFVRGLIPVARSVSSCRRNEDSFTTIAKSLTTLHLAGLTPAWAEYFRPDECAYRLLSLPKYAWNESDYWIPYIGTWTLDKAHLKYGGGQKPTGPSLMAASALRTSLVHQITSETVEQTTADLCSLSDMQHPDFLEAVTGHRMNGCGVATSSIWTDMALTVGEYLYRRLVPQTQNVHMNVSDVEVLHAQVASKSKGSTQPLALEAHLDLTTSKMSLAWFNVDAATGTRVAESFATATVRFEDPQAWRAEWDRVTHLVQGRIEALENMAAIGEASRLSKQLAYTLFKNVVDYAERYRGMTSVVLHEHEAYADIALSTERHGVWHTPPHWIDSVAHLAGLVMNGSEASNTADFFYVTPGCESARLLEPLQPGARYRSYVRMFPVPDDAHMYAGDVYIFNDAGTIVGMVGQIRFRRVPRLLMDRFFSPPSAEPASTAQSTGYKLPVAAIPAPTATAPASKAETLLGSAGATGTTTQAALPPSGGHASTSTSSGGSSGDGFTPASTAASAPTEATAAAGMNADADAGIVTQCLALIARETGLPLSALTPEATFVQLGVDSLMALVLSEKLRAELGVEVRSSLFLECPTVGELGGWLGVYC